MEKNYVDLIRKIVKKTLSENPLQSAAHKWDHVNRVHKMALDLSKEEKSIDMEILEISALLHDIDEPYNDKEGHVKRSVKKAEEILKQINYPNERLVKVLENIALHSSEEIKPKTSMEAKILYDADKLDGLGAVGIARVFTLCGQHGMTPEQAIEYYKKKIKQAFPFLQTEKAKKIMEEELKYVKSFITKFNKENRSIKNT